MSSSENTQLTSAYGYDTKKIIFSEPQVGSVPGNVPISYKRIQIQTKNPDGTIGDLIFPTSKLFAFGVSENVSPDTQKVNGYVMGVCLYNREIPTEEEKKWVDTFNNVVERCKEHLIEVRDKINQHELELRDLKKFNPLYYKKEAGKVVAGTGPTLYAKLIVSKKQDKIITMFYDSDGQSIDAKSLLGKYCYVKAAIKIESIFIGKGMSLQIKLYEAEVKLADTGMKRLMKRPESQSLLQDPNSLSLNTLKFEHKNDDDDGSINGDDHEEKKSVPPPPPTVVKKKIIAAKKIST